VIRVTKTVEPTYLKPVSASVALLGSLYTHMLDDLDEVSPDTAQRMAASGLFNKSLWA